MDRRNFIAGLGALLAAASCSRDEKREKAYDEKQCPFCSMHPGECSYCNGSGKCSFCKGTGKRSTVWTDDAEQNIKKGSYNEQCPHCNGSGKCRYCDGNKKCWACKGAGKINTWDFYDEFISKKQPEGPAK
jgi:RecJ-like exonuclease